MKNGDRIMQKDFTASFENMNKVGVDAMKRFGEIQLRSMELLAEQQIAATTAAFDQGVKQLRSLAESKDAHGAVDSQSSYIAELNAQVMANAQKTAEILAVTKTELTEWVEDGVKAASDTPVAKAVKAATTAKTTTGTKKAA
jgi:phasin family protein